MSASRSQRQTLPPIQNLINAADRGMIDHNQHNAPMSEGYAYPVQQPNATISGGGSGTRIAASMGSSPLLSMPGVKTIYSYLLPIKTGH
ncbi:hypothetical protein RSAG8_06221, partial [Rhizoctonia solani AG-8 WAC10335]